MRRYENVPIEQLKPYENNARTHSDKQVEKIARSIEEFGFINPVLIDSNYGIIAGHGRVEGAKALGMEEVPCLFIEDLSDEQKRAYIIADNKLALDAGWDYELLKLELEELNDLNFDISLTGFDMDIIFDDDEGYYGDERERTNKEYNLEFNDTERQEGYFQMPVLAPCDHIPKDLIGFNYVLSSDRFDCGVHFFVDDYQMTRCWNNPQKYGEKMKPFDCVLTPDFSLYLDMPVALMIYNTYRSRLCGQIWQDMGVKVIPTVSWAEENSYDFCFEGLPKNSTLAVSTIGVKQDENAFIIWKNGMDELIKRKKPKTLLVYGGKVDYDYGDIDVVYYTNAVTERMRKHGE